MNMWKRAITLVGVIALMASTLLSGGAMAEIGTTIQVDNTPSCQDGTLTSMNLTYQGGSDVAPFTFTGTGANFNGQEKIPGIFMELNVNNCIDQRWEVTATITNFQSPGRPPVSAAGKVLLFAPGRSQPCLHPSGFQYSTRSIHRSEPSPGHDWYANWIMAVSG